MIRGIVGRRMCNFLRRVLVSYRIAPRKRVAVALLLAALIFTIAIWNCSVVRWGRELELEIRVAGLREQVLYLESLYNARHEEVLRLQDLLKSDGINVKQKQDTLNAVPADGTELLKNNTGSRTASGLQTSNVHMQTAFFYQLLPHLMDNPNSLRPAYHIKSFKNSTNIVLGIPSVRRDKENYLMLTLQSLINGLQEREMDETLIVVLVGDTDLEYVLEVAREIEKFFPVYFENGLIEVISPPASYYPNFNALTPNLGDSPKRFHWRTKQNLDTMFLMAYVRTKAPYYLMLEDDILANPTYITEIKAFIATVSVKQPNWFLIEFSPTGGIGKLFRSADLIHFITYVQIFYDKFPIDWLLDKYVTSCSCTLEQTSKNCARSKLEIRPKYESNLFQHIGYYSSLKGKTQKIKKDFKLFPSPTFYAHNNPPLASAKTTMKVHGTHFLMSAYLGKDFFWAIKPKKDDTITFIFKKPTAIDSFTFRSGNAEHIKDKFIDTVVEVLPNGTAVEDFTRVGEFDEFGLAEGTIKKDFGPLKGIRLRVTRDLVYWALLSEPPSILDKKAGCIFCIVSTDNGTRYWNLTIKAISLAHNVGFLVDLYPVVDVQELL